MANKIKGKSPIFLIISIICFISAFLQAFLFIAVTFNLFGLNDFIRELYLNMIMAPGDVDGEITFLLISMIVDMLMSVYFAKFYLNIHKFIPVYSKELGQKVLITSIFQLLFGFVISGFVALITSIVYITKKVKPVIQFKDSEDLPSYKLEVMSEAVQRLKKLREIGAISEEEYYANLNKILES